VSGLYVVPGLTTIATTETLPIAFDFVQNIVPGDAPSASVGKLYDSLDNSLVTPTDPATVSGTQVIQIVRGSQLTAKHTYRLDVTTTLNTAKTITGSLVVKCDY
jgi:hypothetical protein